ncbi:hypothetical protein Calla_2447 [Caldicellulosiruptor acetigenus 6A]|uniref:Uncharacterized protein n=1 Tax=Caldicellulosiruptor acetigenus 6A TaxID=632516 RepID=G2PYQ4_9FIRM|nr:hypothetical protein Calla_2447 [Caldicellulosiruptor acetigenus 6A]
MLWAIDKLNVRFQSPKGRLQTDFIWNRLCTNWENFNPQRGGYKQVEKLDFIISTLCTPVNVFMLIHPLKINTNPVA